MQEPTDAESKCLVHYIKPGDIEHGGSASAQIKAELSRLGVSPADARRAGIIAFEGEINLIVYSDGGGTITVCVSEACIEILFKDDGPGIEDIDLALTPGFSTAPLWATDLGFGAGMGLINMQMNADRFEIHSHLGEGTSIRCLLERREDDASGNC